MKSEKFIIPYEVRLQNLAIYGTKGSGKTEHILPMMANEQLDLKDEGALFVVGDSRVGWMIYAMAQKYHRDVTFLSPTYNKGMKELMDIGVSDLSVIQNQLVDFAKVMKEKQVIIIDAEAYQYRKTSTELVGNILMSLQSVMHTNGHDSPFFVYMEDGDTYLQYIRDLLLYGHQFGIGSTLFLQSRSMTHAKSPMLSYFLEANIRTTILSNGLVYDDFSYFKERFYGEGEDDNFILQRSKDQLVLETVVKDMKTVKLVEVRFLAPVLLKEIEEEAENHRSKHVSLTQPSTYAYSVAQSEDEDQQDMDDQKEKVKRKQKATLKAMTIPKAPVPQPSKIFISDTDWFD